MKTYFKTLIVLILFLLKTQLIYSQWTQINIPNNDFSGGSCLLASGDSILLGGNHGSLPLLSAIFLTLDTGQTWTQIFTQISPEGGISHMAFGYAKKSIFATNIFVLYQSSVNGWLISQFTGVQPSAITSTGNWNIIVTSASGIYLSTENGLNWYKVSDNNFNSITFINNNSLIASDGHNLFFSTDYGSNWEQINNNLIVSSIKCLTLIGTNIFAGTSDGLFLSTNNGIDWKIVDNISSSIKSITANENNIFLLRISFNGDLQIWTRPLLGITGVSKGEKDIPNNFELSQNYPNPYNTSTTIKYQIPKTGLINLKVYDILGREVATLVNENKIAGYYEVNFDASKLASGIYIYQLKANDFITSKKMILLK